jgi:two-component system cell cycle response regulator
MYLDLDGFKSINDTHGRPHGDKILKMVTSRLIDASRREDTVARLGGDEFMIVLGNVADLTDAQRPASKLVARLSEPYHINDLTLNLSASIGIAIYPDDADTVAALIGAADDALYEAKRASKNRHCSAALMPVHSDQNASNQSSIAAFELRLLL